MRGVDKGAGYDSARKPYPFDQRKARALLAEAGHANGIDIELWCSTFPLYVRIAETMQAYLGAVGIRVKIMQREAAASRAAAALSLLVMQCLAKVEITRGTAITTLMHTRCPMNGSRWFGRRCGPGEKYKLGACLNSTRSIRWRRGPLTPNTRRKHAFVARRAARRRCA